MKINVVLLCNYTLTLPNHGPFVAILVPLESFWQGDVHNGCFANLNQWSKSDSI
jgi:hypothetical protein